MASHSWERVLAGKECKCPLFHGQGQLPGSIWAPALAYRGADARMLHGTGPWLNPALSQHQDWAWDCCREMGKARGWVRRGQVFCSAAGESREPPQGSAACPCAALQEPRALRCSSPHPGHPIVGFSCTRI